MSEVETPEVTETETPDTETKNKRQMSFTVLDSGVIQASFGEDLEPLTLDPAAVPETVTAAAVTEGLISRSRGYTSKLTAENRTPEKLREAIATAFAALMAGTWKVERDTIAGASFSIEAEAAYLFKVKRAESKGEEFTESLAAVAEAFTKLTDEQKAQLKALPRYKACYAEVKAQRAQATAAALAKKADAEEEDAPF